MLSIKNNIMSANATRHLGSSYSSLAKSVERLSSAYASTAQRMMRQAWPFAS